MRQGLPVSEHFFANIKRVNKASQAILPVFFQQADAAIVDRHAFRTMVELNPQLNEQLTMLASSPALIHSIVCLSRNSDEEVKKAILDTAFKLGNDTAGKQILTLFQMDRVALYKQSYLEAMTALAREHHDLATRLANRR